MTDYSENPVTALYTFLDEGTTPPFEWIVEWADEPTFQRAWREAVSRYPAPGYMLGLLRLLHAGNQQDDRVRRAAAAAMKATARTPWGREVAALYDTANTPYTAWPRRTAVNSSGSEYAQARDYALADALRSVARSPTRAATGDFAVALLMGLGVAERNTIAAQAAEAIYAAVSAPTTAEIVALIGRLVR